MADNMSSEQLFAQANSVWKMLDDLSENDPEAYKNLMSKTMKEGAEYFKPPEPCFCVSTVKQPEVIAYKIYINVCSWDQVPGPKTDQDPIPVMAGQVQECQDKGLAYATVDVIFNPRVLRQVEHKKDHRNLLVHLAIDYLEQNKQMSLSRNYKNLKVKYKGNEVELTTYLKTGQYNGASQGASHLMDPTVAPSAGGTSTTSKESLLHQLSSIAVSDANSDGKGISLFGHDNNRPKKGLIQELSTTAAKPNMRVPVYDVCLREPEGDRPQRIVVTVELPGVSSVNDCELDISESDLQLVVPGVYDLHLDLPEKVDGSNATAAFNKSKHRLTVKVPTRKAS